MVRKEKYDVYGHQTVTRKTKIREDLDKGISEKMQQ